MDSHHSFKLDDLVRDPSFNFLNKLNVGEDEIGHTHDFLGTDPTDSPYSHSSFNTNYFDTQQFIEKFSKNKRISLMSLNIQSLPAKFDSFNELILDLSNNGCAPDVICLQETWNVVDSNLFSLPGYQPFIYTNRCNAQGGGIGIYIKMGI
jgi:hypothetical protein